MFVFEDPGKLGSKDSKARQQSLAKSHAALKTNERRRQQRKALTKHASTYQKLAPRASQSNTPLRPLENTVSKDQHGIQSNCCKKPHWIAMSDENSGQVECNCAALVQPNRNQACYVHTEPRAITVNIAPLEGRSLQFFKEKASLKWCGWSDTEFWNNLALQIAEVEPSARCALVSIGAFHEASELAISDPRTEDYQRFAFQQNTQALTHLAADHSGLSLLALVSIYIMLSGINVFTQDTAYLEVVRQIAGMREQLQSPRMRLPEDTRSCFLEYLEPIISQQLSALSQSIDMIWCLRRRPMTEFVTTVLEIPNRFVSVNEARNILQRLLNWTTYLTKILKLPANKVPPQAEIQLQRFFDKLIEFRGSEVLSERDESQVAILNVMAKIGFMLIRCMHADEDDELIYDQFTPVYSELAEVFRHVIELDVDPSQRSYNIVGSVDGGLACAVGQAAMRWCRDPDIRRELISLLARSKRREGPYAAEVWAMVAEATMRLEERDITPTPRSCHDIPLRKRVKLESTGINYATKLQYMQFRHFPFNPQDITTVWINHAGCQDYLDGDPEIMKTTDKPHLILGLGHTSWLVPGSSEKYHIIGDAKFNFPIPKF